MQFGSLVLFILVKQAVRGKSDTSGGGFVESRDRAVHAESTGAGTPDCTIVFRIRLGKAKTLADLQMWILYFDQGVSAPESESSTLGKL